MGRTTIPTGNAANVYSVLKWLNILRTVNLRLAEDALDNVEVLLCEIRAMIVRDNNVAAQVLRAMGARTEFCKVVHPRVSESFENLRFPGDENSFILGHSDPMVQSTSSTSMENLSTPVAKS